MKLYIASSWRNQHAIEMLTKLFRDRGHELHSSIENWETQGLTVTDDFPPDDITTAIEQFDYDTHAAITADALIYIAPSGSDAWAQVGAAWAKGVPIFGLQSKGETIGLMKQMVYLWCNNFRELLNAIPDAGTDAERDNLELIRRTRSHVDKAHAMWKP